MMPGLPVTLQEWQMQLTQKQREEHSDDVNFVKQSLPSFSHPSPNQFAPAPQLTELKFPLRFMLMQMLFLK